MRISTNSGQASAPREWKCERFTPVFQDKFNKTIETSLKETLFIGDGAFKISIDTNTSKLPIIEWYPGENVEFVYVRGKIKEIVFKTAYKENRRRYVLNERYGYGYIDPDIKIQSKTRHLIDALM